MASERNFKVEGVTAFDAPPAPAYGYIIELKNSQISIWMENRTSKEQWFKGGMVKTDIVSSANAIPDASMARYIQCFRDILDRDLSNSRDAQRKKCSLKGGALRLELAVTIDVLRSTWVAKYTFDLEPISVERIDILESKLRDQQEGLEKLRGELESAEVASFIQLKASTKDANSRIVWNEVKRHYFSSHDGVVTARRGGVYTIGVAVTATTCDNSQHVRLQRNGTTIQEVYLANAEDFCISATLYAVVPLEKEEELTVTCSCQLVNSSSLSLHRLGN